MSAPQPLYSDEWTTVTPVPDRFKITWLNRSAGLAVVHACFRMTVTAVGFHPSSRARMGKALVGSDGGTWLDAPAFDIADARAHADVVEAGLLLAVEHVKAGES